MGFWLEIPPLRNSSGNLANQGIQGTNSPWFTQKRSLFFWNGRQETVKWPSLNFTKIPQQKDKHLFWWKWVFLFGIILNSLISGTWFCWWSWSLSCSFWPSGLLIAFTKQTSVLGENPPCLVERTNILFPVHFSTWSPSKESQIKSLLFISFLSNCKCKDYNKIRYTFFELVGLLRFVSALFEPLPPLLPRCAVDRRRWGAGRPVVAVTNDRRLRRRAAQQGLETPEAQSLGVKGWNFYEFLHSSSWDYNDYKLPLGLILKIPK